MFVVSSHPLSSCYDVFQPEHGIGRYAQPPNSPEHHDWTTIELAWVSGKHCWFKVFEADEDKKKPLSVTVTDTSSNGTYVNGERLKKGTAATVQDGDTIHIFKSKTKVQNCCSSLSNQAFRPI
jgi:pSer/pThr/pTyr-binding forkhead associated (FHA) protein